jgi:hypothetical protein
MTGAAGTMGAAGAAGTTGAAGAAGTTGPAGAAGTTGPAGGAGATGTAGAAGTTGTAGAAGTTGAAGITGAAGAAGAGGAAGMNGAAGTTGGAGGQGGGCGNPMKTLRATAADILILQDKSGSMNNDPNDQACNGGCGANSKWSLVTTAINDVVGSTDGAVDWGLKFFATSNSGCSITAAVEVPVGPSNAVAIAGAIASAMPGSSTPTRVAEQNAVTYLQSVADTNPKYILLATDGLPNCMPGGNVNGDDSAGTVAAVGDALTAGFPTFVVGIGALGAIGGVTLDAMAMAGGVPQIGGATSFYEVTDTASLVDVLNQIVSTTVSCTFELGTPPAGASNAAFTVVGDGAAIPMDAGHTSGWDYGPSTGQITFYGSPCDAIKARTLKTVSVTYICN